MDLVRKATTDDDHSPLRYPSPTTPKDTKARRRESSARLGNSHTNNIPTVSPVVLCTEQHCKKTHIISPPAGFFPIAKDEHA